MNGLKWTSYVSTIGSAGVNVAYTRSITYFNSPPTSITSGVVNKIQIDSSYNIYNPPISTFTLNQTTIPAIKFNGYFYAPQTRNYTFRLGVVDAGIQSEIRDIGILFIGLPNSTIVPNSTFTISNNNLSNQNPIIFSGTEINRFIYDASVNLTAGNFYPILFYYNKVSNNLDNNIFKFGLYFSYQGGSPITYYTGYIYSYIPIVNGITYNGIENTQTVEVVASKGSPYINTITIPNNVTMSDGLVFTVVRLGDSAFSGCSGITIDISSCTSITNIQSTSFSGCISFAIILPSSVTTIGDYTFSYSGLTAITLTSSITSIGAYAFENCGLTTIALPSSLTSIGVGAFSGCSGITIDISSCTSITNIQSTSFSGCISFAIILPSSVTTIGDYTFSESGLTAITLPSTLTYIGDGAFEFCGLTTITLPSSLTSIGDQAFMGCASLTSITLSPSIIDLGLSTFNGCGFTELDLSSYTYITYLGNYVFNNCSNLTTIILPPSITSIGEYAFNDCSSLTSITFTNDSILPTIQSDSFYNIGANPIIYIKDYAYRNNLNYSSIQMLKTSIPSVSIIITNFTCFKEGSLILTDKGYMPIEKLKRGDLIQTYQHGYKPIHMIGYSDIIHSPKKKRVKDQLYLCSSFEYPEIFEDLVLTGCHSILVDDFKNNIERENTINVNGHTYVTDRKYRLPACVDDRTIIYKIPGKYKIYHLALENDDYFMNYGIYANGLLVETCSIRFLKECSNLKII